MSSVTYLETKYPISPRFIIKRMLLGLIRAGRVVAIAALVALAITGLALAVQDYMPGQISNLLLIIGAVALIVGLGELA